MRGLSARLSVTLLFAVHAWGAIDVEQRVDVRVAMRDGVKLSTNIFRPPGTGRFPTLLIRTPYGKGTLLSPNQRPWIDHGYALVIQDVRGRHASEGLFRPMEQEGPDGEDTIAWIARQTWSDGKVGMMGGSYLGVTQWQAALRNPPALKAIFPGVSGFDDYLDRFYSRGGGFKLGHRLLWMEENLNDSATRPTFLELVRHLPLRTADRLATGRSVDWYQRALDHPNYDAFWRAMSTRDRLDKIHVPVYAVGGWFDNYAQSDLEAFAALRGMGREAHVLIGPWPHDMNNKLTAVDFGPEWYVPLRGTQMAWFDHWLKGKDTAAFAPARYFTMGVNRWTEASAWPPANARPKSFFLGSNGKLQDHHKLRDEADEFTYDPRQPVPTRGGAVCCNFKVLPPGPLDQRPIENRADMLVYTGDALKSDLEVTGVVRLLLYASTSAPDTDFTAKLVDVYPDGSAMSITDGMLRMRYRNGLEKPELAKPGEVYGMIIDAGPTSIVFRAGHRIRVEISSSNFPRFDRNPNTGRAIADETEMRVAHQAVHRGGKFSSAIVLPVVRGGRP